MALSLKSPAMALPFLRPLGLPRPSTINHFLRAFRASSTVAATPSPATPSTTVASLSHQAASKPYRINLTPSQSYPIYTLKKRGGNMKLTKIRKLEGDLAALRSELQEALGLEKNEVAINQLTRHIIVKGHKKPEIVQFFKDRSL